MKRLLILLFLSIGKCDVPYLDFLEEENAEILTLSTICSNFRNATVSLRCRKELEVVCENETLFWTVLDASAKFPYSGISYSTKMDYGNYDQCMTVDHSYSNGRILGEYCLAGLWIPDLQNLEDGYALAVCRPSGCYASDYNAIMKELLSLPDEFPGLFLDKMCQTKETTASYTAGDIIVLTIFGIFIALMIASTLYDIYIKRMGLGTSHPLYFAFSVFSNGKKLLHISKHSTSKEHIEVFHGIRVISMLWIVAGHVFSTWENVAVTNIGDVGRWPQKISSFHMTAAHLAVDTFFFMSGFLLAFQYFKGKIKTLKEQVISVPQMIVHRYLRLTPAMLMLYLMTITFFVHLGSGPLWPTVNELFSNTCKKYWWRFFLYIQNYFDFNEMCLLQTWYLSADMQLFLISPLIIIPLSLLLKKLGYKFSMVVLLIMNIIWAVLPMVIKLATDYKNEYDTHSRLIDYFIGVMLGVFMRFKIDKPFLYMINDSFRHIINLVIWVIVILGMLVVLICYQDQSLNHGFVSIQVFQSLMRPAWCIGLSWITYSCHNGRGGFINWILCRPFFQVLGKLTYCIYLLHITVVAYYAGTTRTKWFFTEYNNFYQFCGHYVVSVILAAFWTLAFESPLIIIEKYLFGRGRPARKEQSLKNIGIDERS